MPEENGSIEQAGLLVFNSLHAPHCSSTVIRLHEMYMQPVECHIRFEASQVHGTTLLKHIIFRLFTVQCLPAPSSCRPVMFVY